MNLFDENVSLTLGSLHQQLPQFEIVSIDINKYIWFTLLCN